ncbi:MAG: hypothetical protein M1820_007531 [Bogoriella megaspora]|nr:MAG: hypothetical protein M1820_007531 [Bogoriella megaspora]
MGLHSTQVTATPILLYFRKRAFSKVLRCLKVRCIHCGFQRAKNTTRQIEHLQQCQEYLNSPQAQELLAESEGDLPNGRPNGDNIFNGSRPNPNLQVNRRGPNQNKRKPDQAFGPSGALPSPGPRVALPSLTNHLLGQVGNAFRSATQQPFLSHAGCGTISANALSQWLTQDSHYARGYVSFIGQLIAKVRLPAVKNTQFHILYRIMDLLISALNNIRREMSFFEITATKYSINLSEAPPNPICRAYLDLFNSSSGAGASLLEGMVVLWATEHCYLVAWQYAASFSQSLNTPSASGENHIVALHQALIPNWTSSAFSKFVYACKDLVDELANESSERNGKELAMRCEDTFRQICWLEQRFWPEVDGMGEERDTGTANGTNGDSAGGLLDGVEEAATEA